jgi:hypothetical protein
MHDVRPIGLRWAGPISLVPGNPHALFSSTVVEQPGIVPVAVPTAAGQLIRYVAETGLTFAIRHEEPPRCYNFPARSPSALRGMIPSSSVE